MSYVTKDSGVREEFESGMKRDTQAGKPRFDLVIPEGVPYQDTLLSRWASLMERGAVKYGDRNWEKANSVEEFNRARASAFRHFIQWYHGEQDEDHGAAVVFNIQEADVVRGRLAQADRDANPPPIADLGGVPVDNVKVYGPVEVTEGWEKANPSPAIDWDTVRLSVTRDGVPDPEEPSHVLRYRDGDDITKADREKILDLEATVAWQKNERPSYVKCVVCADRLRRNVSLGGLPRDHEEVLFVPFKEGEQGGKGKND